MFNYFNNNDKTRDLGESNEFDGLRVSIGDSDVNFAQQLTNSAAGLQAPLQRFTITAKLLNQKTYSITVDALTTVLELKRRIEV
jgi:hypothetical protein